VSANRDSEILYGNGYIKGAFDMVNRYNAGDWRQYYFDIKDHTINAASIDVSWSDPDTNFSLFVIDPQGRLVQTNVPPGVFGQFLDWPTSDWLGTSVFSEGGGFYPVKNKDATSTVLYAPINQTGTYGLLLHSTLFGGAKPTEPFALVAQFSTILADSSPPKIEFAIPDFVSQNADVPRITDDSDFSVRYYLDGSEIMFDQDTIQTAGEGPHELRIEAADELGNLSTGLYSFVIDRTPPEILVRSPQDNAKAKDILAIDFEVIDENPDNEKTAILLSDGLIQNNTKTTVDISDYAQGKHRMVISAEDRAGNKSSKILTFEIGASQPALVPSPATQDVKSDYNLVLLGMAGAVAIGVAIFIAFSARPKKPAKF
jgi:hypothetical protein